MKISVGVIQAAFSTDAQTNNQKVIHYLKQGASQGAQLILPPELFLGHYFCKIQNEKFFSLAHPIDNHPQITEIQKVAKDLSIVVPCSFFEKSGPHYFNSLALIDADGSILGVYRKSHIPDGPGYQEKFYFRPGNTGLRVFNSKYGKIGAAICWDQWFPEAARIMTLNGADILCYPTAIGSEPHAPDLSTCEPWLRVMKGHAVANMIPIVAANRIGVEDGQTFYGASFICNEFGEECARFQAEEGVAVAEVDIDKAEKNRAAFGFFRDRRVDLYNDLVRL